MNDQTVLDLTGDGSAPDDDLALATYAQRAYREYALSVYSGVFTQMMWIGLVAGALLFAATPLLKRLTRG